MLALLVVILFFLWYFGYIHIAGLTIPDVTLFYISGQPITLFNILILLVISSIIGFLPSPLREIAGVLLILWILSVLGILAIGGLSTLLVLAIILGIVAYLLGLL